MEVLEGILSFFVAIFAGIAIGIGFAVKTLISVLLYLLENSVQKMYDQYDEMVNKTESYFRVDRTKK